MTDGYGSGFQKAHTCYMYLKRFPRMLHQQQIFVGVLYGA